jgi:hypothetical protein
MSRYYDLILGLIPVALGGITALLATIGVSLTAAVPIAAAVAAGLIGHGVFVNAPIDGTEPAAPPANAAD